MPGPSAPNDASRPLRRLLTEGSLAGMTDAELLSRFAERRDEVAFAALVARHGPMVRATCRGTAGDAHAAEDAYQAAFLALALRAGSLWAEGGSLAAWLHRVAHRAAARAASEASRRREAERRAGIERAASLLPPGPDGRDELRALVHREVARLPERLRRPVVLCDLAGLTYAQAAAELGRGEATVRRRRAEAHALLRSRLGRRGVTPSVAPIATLLGRAASSPPPAITADGLARAASAVFLAGRSATVSGVAPAAVGLAASVLRAGLVARSTVAAAVVLAAGMTAALASGIGPGLPGLPAPPPVVTVEAALAPAAVPLAPRPEPQAPAADGGDADSVAIAGLVVDPDGRPVAGAVVSPEWRGEPSRGASDLSTISDPDGRFAVPIPRIFYEEFRRVAELEGITLYATAPGFAPGWATVSPTPDGPEPATIRLAVDDRPIEGRIVDLEGRPVAGATVEASHGYAPKGGDLASWAEEVRRSPQSPDGGPTGGPLRPIPFRAASTTDADGRFRLDGLGAGRLAALTVRGPSIASESAYAMTADLDSIRAEVDRGIGPKAVYRYYGPGFEHAAAPTKPIEGVVRDAEAGAPVAGATVRGNLRSESSFMPRSGVEATTDADGRYRLLGLPTIARDDRYWLFVEPPSGSPYPGRGALVEAGTPAFEPVPFDIELRRGVRVRGRVTDKATGAPISQGWAQYFAFADNPRLADYDGFSRFQPPMAYLDEQGRFELVALPGGGVVGARTELPGYLPGIGFEAIDHRADFSPSALNTVPFYANALNFQAIVEIDPEPGAGPIDLELQCDPGRAVSVRLVDPEGEPIAGAVARGLDANDFVDSRALDAADCEATGVDPRRPRRVFFVHEERGLSGSLQLLGDEQGEQVVRLEPSGSLVGRVVNGDGMPRDDITIEDFLPGALPEEFQPDRGDFTGWGIAVGADGRFRIDGLVPGLRYDGSATLRRNFTIGPLFEDVVLEPGEARDLGDLRVVAPGEAD